MSKEILDDWEKAAEEDFDPVGLTIPETKEKSSKDYKLQIQNSSLNYTEYKPQIRLLARPSNLSKKEEVIKKGSSVVEIEKGLLQRKLEYEKARKRIFETSPIIPKSQKDK
ncbi:hypothetical protein K502DRAFT_363782 [Neoconidiobolus thromboides FSU 785]|nr:hypothetical protein K502DRAFT_363782 [Neoconidiobolus thromboides FSU 785]